MDTYSLTSFGQIEIYNQHFRQKFIPSKFTPTQCINDKYSYCVTYDGKRIPIMIGSKFHTHPDDNPLKMLGYFIIDGTCKSVSSMYVYDKMLYTKDRAYISTGRVSIVSMGRYNIHSKGEVHKWDIPINYDTIYDGASDPRLKTHLDIVFNHSAKKSPGVTKSDAMILRFMFESYLGIDTSEYIPLKRLITAGEMIYDAYVNNADIIKYFRTNTWTVKNIQNVNSVSEDMKHYSIIGDIESIRRVTYPTVREITRMEDRYVKDYNRGIFCPVQTSDGTLCGTIMYLCLGARISGRSKYDIVPGEKCMIFVDGKYKCTGDDVTSTSASIYRHHNTIHVLTNYGRIIPSQSSISYAVSFIPYRTHNPAVRSMFTSSIIKQAISKDPRLKSGWFHNTKYLIQGEQPLTGIPFPHECGWNVTVAIMPYFGYNVEDAIVVSDRLANEMFKHDRIYIYTSMFENNYDKVIERAVSIGDNVHKGDILYTVYHPADIVTLETVRANTDGKVTDIYESKRCYKVKVVRTSGLEVGDKMSSRHGQKGIVSKIELTQNMPQYWDGSCWKYVDLIMNPHTFPTRKTMGQLLEMGNTTYKVKIGYVELKEPIIVGKCYYMALRHQVADKIQFRNKGAIDIMTHQAVSGKSRRGGLRFGHMERDILLAVGAHKELEELWSIDKIKATSCNVCGKIEQTTHVPCPHPRITFECHQYLLICLCLLRANSHDILYYPDTKEYEIVDFDISTTPQIYTLDHIHFGFTHILELKHYLPKSSQPIPIIPSILRTVYLENMYKRMFNRSKHDDILKEVKRMLTSKSGMYHNLVEGHRVDHCVRSVIVPAPYLKPDTIELPLGCDIGTSYGLLNRQPSLNIQSMMSVNLVIGKHKTIGIHPNLCTAFNADFDGDEMCVFGIKSPCDKLPIHETPTQDYKHSLSLSDLTYHGLTATHDGIKSMIDNNIKGTDVDYQHIYKSIGEVIVAGKVEGVIENNYLNGLTEDEWYLQSKAGREGASSIGINTPFIGDLNSTVNRTLI